MFVIFQNSLMKPLMKVANVSTALIFALVAALLALVIAAPLLGLIMIAPIIIYVCYLRYLKQSGNFHEVIPERVYRSGRLSVDQLRRAHSKVPIRSIINLLGNREGVEWYSDQTNVAEALGIAHFDFRVSGVSPLPKDRALELIELMRTAPKPMLIHCKAGADRSGLASALYLASIEGASKTSSEREISMRYGHIGVPYLSSGYAMKESWANYQSWLGFSK